MGTASAKSFEDSMKLFFSSSKKRPPSDTVKLALFSLEKENAALPKFVPPDRKAPDGQIWQCQACGKRSSDLYDGPGSWDESCSLNAVLVAI
jgi:hypothetical protein